MSQPTPYTPTTDFSQQESINASGRSTVSTSALDAELANIGTTLGQALANLTLLQRDDGRMKDVSVELHTLSPEVLNLMGGFNLRGLWSEFTVYAKNDLCSNGAYTYVCRTAHASGAAFDAANWIQFGFTSGADAAQAAASAQTSASAAAVSATASSGSATSSAGSAATASAQALSATTSASIATTKAGSASTSATNAALSAAAAATAAASIDTLTSLAESGGAARVGFTQSGSGAVARTVQDELRGSISVKQFGAGAGGDDTAAFQNAINAAGTNGTISIPKGVYYLSATLTCPPNFTIKGEGANSTLLRRSADYGDTFQFGNATTACAHVRIYDLWMMHGSANYTKGTNSLPDLAAQGAHLRVFGSQEAIISNVWLWRLPYQIVFEGGSLGVIDKCHFYGIWDNDYPAAQEGISQVTYRTAPALGIVTSMKIRDSFFTGDAAFARNVTFSTSTGNVIKSITDCVGSQYGVDIACSEDFDMTGCYLSAHSRNSVLIDPSGGDPAFELRFANNFFDVAKSQSILVVPTSTNASYVNINGNTFNGEGTGIHAINILSASGTFGSHSTSITNNNFLAHIGTPILAAGLYAGVISGNTFASYNILNVHATDPSYCSAIYCTDKTGNVAIHGNVIGYGTYCYKGIFIEPGLVNVSQYCNINTGAVSFSPQAFPIPVVNPGGYGVIGVLKGADFNTTGDQAIQITIPPNFSKYTIGSFGVTNTSIPLTAAVGGIYPSPGKAGAAYVPATQGYTSPGSGPSAMSYLSSSNIGMYQSHVDPVLYLSLSTPQGAAATGDIYVSGTFLP